MFATNHRHLPTFLLLLLLSEALLIGRSEAFRFIYDWCTTNEDCKHLFYRNCCQLWTCADVSPFDGGECNFWPVPNIFDQRRLRGGAGDDDYYAESALPAAGYDGANEEAERARIATAVVHPRSHHPRAAVGHYIAVAAPRENVFDDNINDSPTYYQ